MPEPGRTLQKADQSKPNQELQRDKKRRNPLLFKHSPISGQPFGQAGIKTRSKLCLPGS
jgi:hypothetical protein